MRKIRENSSILDQLVQEDKIAIVGAIYDIATGEVSFFQATDVASPIQENYEKGIKEPAI